MRVMCPAIRLCIMVCYFNPPPKKKNILLLITEFFFWGIYVAISEGHGDVALELLKVGAETDKRDVDGHLAIDLAPDIKVSFYSPHRLLSYLSCKTLSIYHPVSPSSPTLSLPLCVLIILL